MCRIEWKHKPICILGGLENMTEISDHSVLESGSGIAILELMSKE